MVIGKAHFSVLLATAFLALAFPSHVHAASHDCEKVLTLNHWQTRVGLDKSLLEVINDVRAHGPPRGLALAPASSYATVAEISDLPSVYIAVFNSKTFMNLALDRASTFIEEGHLRNHFQQLADRRIYQVEGHDLVGPRLLDYWKAFEAAEEGFEKPQPNDRDSSSRLAIERNFWDEFLLPTLKKDLDMVIIAVAIDTDMNATLSHEILHAQFFKSPEMRKIVEEFWRNDVTEAHKAQARQILEPFYNTKDEFLMMNEFQAYMLMSNPMGRRNGKLAPLVPQYRDALMKKLTAAGIKPIQFDMDKMIVAPVMPRPPSGGGGHTPVRSEDAIKLTAEAEKSLRQIQQNRNKIDMRITYGRITAEILTQEPTVIEALTKVLGAPSPRNQTLWTNQMIALGNYIAWGAGSTLAPGLAVATFLREVASSKNE